MMSSDTDGVMATATLAWPANDGVAGATPDVW